MSIRHLDRLLEPRSVAVICASNRVGSVGATVWRNLRAGQTAAWTETWFNGHGLYRLRGTIQYPKAA